jgi:hypothetical protein
LGFIFVIAQHLENQSTGWGVEIERISISFAGNISSSVLQLIYIINIPMVKMELSRYKEVE